MRSAFVQNSNNVRTQFAEIARSALAEDLRGRVVLFGDQPQQQVLGPDVVVPQSVGPRPRLRYSQRVATHVEDDDHT